MSQHECIQEGFLGEVKEFIQNSKGLKATVFTVAVAIAVQVCSFLYLWGSLTTTVNQHTKVLSDTAPIITENTRNIDKILAKFELIQVIRGGQGPVGATGAAGKDR